MATLGHYKIFELAYDNEPVLAAGATVTKPIRSNDRLPHNLANWKFCGKSRASLPERCIQTVLGQAKTIIPHLQDRAKIVFDELRVFQSWALVHACWLLNRYHVKSATGTTAYLSVKGRHTKTECAALVRPFTA